MRWGRDSSSSLRATAAKSWWKRNHLRSPSSGTRNRLARSRSLRIVALSLRPSRWSHSAAENRSSTETSRMKSRSLSGMPAEDLLGEVVPDEPVAPAEAVHEVVGVRSVGEGERGEVEGRGPALGPLDQLGEGVVREGDARAGDQLARLLRREGQVLGPELGQVVGHAQPSQPEAGVGPGDDHQVRLCPAGSATRSSTSSWRAVSWTKWKSSRTSTRSSGMAASAAMIVASRVGGACRRAAEHPRGLDEGQHAPRPFEGRGHVAPQPRRVVVPGVEGDPRGGRALLALQPLGDHGGLAVAGRSSHEGDRTADRAGHGLHQARSVDPARATGRRVELHVRQVVHGRDERQHHEQAAPTRTRSSVSLPSRCPSPPSCS